MAEAINLALGTYREGDRGLPVRTKIRPMVDSGSVLITGTPGSGKSVMGQWLICQLARQGIPVIAIDLRSTLTGDQFFSPLQKELVHWAKRYDLYTGHLYCPLFRPTIFKDGTAETEYDAAAAIASILADHCRFGSRQRSILADACETVIQSASYGQWGIAAVKHALENLTSKGALEVSHRLRSLLLHNPFVDGPRLYTTPNIHIFDLSKYANDQPTQASIAELILFYLWKQMSSAKEQTPVYLYCDEFQNIGLRRSGVLGKILTEGRKFGLNVILITQSLAMNFSPEEQQLLLQIPYSLVFHPAGREADRWSKTLSPPESRHEMTQLMKNLPRGSYVLSGPVYLGEEQQCTSEAIQVVADLTEEPEKGLV